MIYEVGAVALLFLFVGFVIGWTVRGMSSRNEKK